jgi:5-methylcytosine-specific restriction endonuclease McrA
MITATLEENAKRRTAYAESMKDPEHRKIVQERLRKYRKNNRIKCNQMDADWRSKNKERSRSTKKLWVTKNKFKDSESHRKSYFRNREKRLDYRRKYYAKNKDAFAARHKARVEKFPEDGKKRSRRHYLNNKEKYVTKAQVRRALQLNAGINLKGINDFVKSVRSKSFVICYYCEKKTPSKGCHFDHIVPLSSGGHHSVENLCTTCPRCNLSKNNKPVQIWKSSGQQLFPI